MFNNNWTINGNEVRVNIPFAKVNKERRTVSGFATLDNVDTHGDVVDADASVAAFSRFRGNLREMHQPLAVGKVVDFVPQEFEDPETDETYKGIFVTAYISKGAEDTWQKVLDGTLSGFSVGGVIKNKEANKTAGGGSIIKEYDLIELSLVDNPANQLANVFSIEKLGDTTVASGIAVETKVQNILYNSKDDVVILSDDESRDGFENIGWVEDTEGKTEKMQEALTKYLEGSLEHRSEEVRRAWYKKYGYGADEFVMSVYDDFIITRSDNDKTFRYTYTEGDDGYEFGERTEVEIKVEISEKMASSDENAGEDVNSTETSSLNKSEGGANVATEEKNDETVEEVEKSADVEETDETTEEETEKAADVTEVAAGSEVDVDAIVKAVSESVTTAVTKVAEESSESLNKTQTSLNEALENLNKDLSKKIDELDERLTGVESGTATKKSADVVDDDDEAEQDDKEDSFWRGGFLGTNDLVK